MKQMGKLKLQESYGSWAQRWLEEYYGDDAQCIQIVNKLNLIEKVEETQYEGEVEENKVNFR